MSWVREHRVALIVAPLAAIALAIAVYSFDVIPRLPLDSGIRTAQPGEPIEVDGYRLDPITITPRDDEGLLPEGVQLYAVEVGYELVAPYDEGTCIAVRLIEVDGERRGFEPFQDWDVGRVSSDAPANCVSAYEGKPGTTRISFVVPNDHGSFALILGGPLNERVQVAIGD